MQHIPSDNSTPEHEEATSSLEQSKVQASKHADQVIYRDLVIFEERLRGNMIRLQRRKRKFEALLCCLLLLLAYFFYAVFVDPSKAFTNHLLNTMALLIAAGSLVFFYRSGMYSEKIIYAAEFVPHCNRALQSFNLQFNKKGESGELSFYPMIPKQLQDGFDRYRKQYHARKKARQQANKVKTN
ncbi:Spo7-like protein-domain-containing protein [Halteromyces radiatus]|uniref:Spo7-like protein-domain-containing protein n=1 Tax=Halteromyces radiatus TaxID=101107 RepID=UPI00221F2AE0|nr:Spo7-like protein-domain-containing protein [Halteromyces radiatus]KAI8088732.1 Spo7-like protein-domain-containing protein [Halteromyces radiatus]